MSEAHTESWILHDDEHDTRTSNLFHSLLPASPLASPPPAVLPSFPDADFRVSRLTSELSATRRGYAARDLERERMHLEELVGQRLKTRIVERELEKTKAELGMTVETCEALFEKSMKLERSLNAANERLERISEFMESLAAQRAADEQIKTALDDEVGRLRSKLEGL